MAWAEAYAEKQGGMQDLIGQVQQQRQEKAEKTSSGIGGLFKLLGGAALMIFSAGTAVPAVVAGGMMAGGIGMAGSGIGDIF